MRTRIFDVGMTVAWVVWIMVVMHWKADHLPHTLAIFAVLLRLDVMALKHASRP